MPQNTLHVIARLEAKPEKVAELHELLVGLLAAELDVRRYRLVG